MVGREEKLVQNLCALATEVKTRVNSAKLEIVLLRT